MARLNDQLQKAWAQLQSGNTHVALGIIDAVLARAPANPQALCMLGMARVTSGDMDNAVAPLQSAVRADPRNGMALDSLGLAFLSLGRFSEAAEVLRRAAALPNAPPVVSMRLGMALLNLNDASGAVLHLTRAVRQQPADLSLRLNLGRALYSAGDMAAAREQFLATVQGAPSELDAREGLALSCVALGRLAEALPHLRFVVDAEPDNTVALYALSSALFETGQLNEAERRARHLIGLTPAAANVCLLLSNIWFIQGKWDDGVRLLEDAYARSSNSEVLGVLTFQYRQICDWPRWQAAWDKLAPLIDGGLALGSPFWLLCEPITPLQQLRYTQTWAQARYRNLPALARGTATAPRGKRGERRLRIGYLSSDFQEHAAAYLVAEVMELHDRTRFEIFAYSYGPEGDSPMRQRLLSAFEHFVDIAWETDDAAAARIRADQIDILVEIKGYTVGDRITIMARRPCDIQVTWLGYPGTLGAPFVDYLIADPYIIRAGEESSCCEKVLRMPHCYQPNDRKRRIAEPLSRAQYGLPQHGFIFCCFNQTYKITPDVFAVWMQLLTRVAGSVLWLVESSARAKHNLAAAAQMHGVAADRLVFAPHLPCAQHLARYRVADLALDTWPYTSHTTVSDGLWCGCLAVGLTGETFAARVSGSVLTAANLADLVTTNLRDYEALAFRLASDAAVLQSYRERLEQARDASPLFDIPGFTRDLERLYLDIAAA